MKGKIFFNNSIFSLLVGVSIGLYLMIFMAENLNNGKKLEEFAFSEGTQTLYGEVNGVSIHCGDFSDMQKCIKGYKSNGANQDVVLWLGNSQLHAINQIKSNDKTAAMVLHEELNQQLKYLLTFSQANANLSEHHVLFQELIEELHVTTLILPVFFDDMREYGVRETILKGYQNQNVEIKESIIEFRGINQNNDVESFSGKIQKSVEEYLDLKIGEGWSVWNNRVELRGQVLGGLYSLRNEILGINASSIRHKIPGRYLLNLNHFIEILKLANENEIEVLVYIPPLRNDEKIPYSVEEYRDFKKEIQSISKKNNALFFNFEDVVPNELWGNKKSTSLDGGGEIDFMHFQAEGHNLLAISLHDTLTQFFFKDNDI